MNPTDVASMVSKEELFCLAERMVTTPSHPDVGTTELVSWLSRELADQGLCTCVEAASGPEHLNLIIDYPGTENGYLLLNGHLDTVPPATPPQPVLRNQQRLYGRGAVDMKGATAAMCLAVVALHRANVKLKRGVMMSAVCGEEIGGLGTHAFLETGRPVEMAIIGEPTNLSLVTSHKGVQWLGIEFSGQSGHASRPDLGANALVAAAYAATALWEKGVQTASPHPLLGTPTLNVGCMHSGANPNVIPDECVLRIDRRWLPGESIEAILAQITGIVREAADRVPGVSVRVRREDETLHCCPMETPTTHPLVSEMQEVLTSFGMPGTVHGVPYGTDGSWLCSYDIPCVVCGPGSIEQAHSSVEYIELEELWNAYRVYVSAALQLCLERATNRSPDIFSARPTGSLAGDPKRTREGESHHV